MAALQKIRPCLWFDDQAEEAARFYVRVFEDSGIDEVQYYGTAGFETHGKPAGSVLLVNFRLAGQSFTALNGGPQFQFTEAISLQVSCASQQEVDRFWEQLSQDGEEGPCGWLKDRYGLSWQINPTALDAMMRDSDEEKVARVTEAFLKMKKFDIAALERAYAGA